MNAFIFGLLTIISLFIFFNLGKVKASKKQTQRDNRVNWSKPPWKRKQQSNVNRNQPTKGRIVEGKAEEVDSNEK
ncbi:hypothetical protein M9C84_06005 [SAR86 cluster bacterium]|jgi:hypothetical protein|nr:hypothetical protein M9C84_06005 [SAR86 cluster bacterium]|tara:strand:- start:1234 stop:1458 length:225 start_codon:yes stop_codon:yes gene_type:complete